MPSANGDGLKRAVLYARVSTDEQARTGYSLRQQIEALRTYAAHEGYEVPEDYEVTDPGYSGVYLERPGLDRVRDLVEAGGVGIVLAQDADRITREPYHRDLLDEEFSRYGCILKALDDWGDDTHEGQLLKFIKGWQAKGERLKTAERTRRGKVRRAREGKVIPSGSASFGFNYTADGTNYVVDEAAMPVVRRIFKMVGVEGKSFHGTKKALESEGVRTASKGRYWNVNTIRKLINHDVYRPHTHTELSALVDEGLLAPAVLAGLDPDKSYGIWWYNRDRVTRTRAGGKGRKYEPKPRSEWVAIPVPDSGVPAEWVDGARTAMADNRRPSNAGHRFWELSGGVLYCPCGGRMTIHHKTGKGGGYNYYMCPVVARDGKGACNYGKLHRAEPLEKEVAGFVSGLLKNPKPLIRDLDQQIELERKASRNPDREAAVWLARLEELDTRRVRLQDGYLAGLFTADEVRAKQDELSEDRDTIKTALDGVRNRQERLKQLERDRAALLDGRDGEDAERLEDLTPEQRRDVYGRLHLHVSVYPDGDLEMAGVYGRDLPADVGPRPGAIYVSFAKADKYEAHRQRYEVARARFKADYEAGRVDPQTYHAYAEEGNVPDRYWEEARSISGFATDTLEAMDPRYPEAEAGLEGVTISD